MSGCDCCDGEGGGCCLTEALETAANGLCLLVENTSSSDAGVDLTPDGPVRIHIPPPDLTSVYGMTVGWTYATLRFAGVGTFDGDPCCWDIRIPIGFRCETVEGVQQLQFLVFRTLPCSPNTVDAGSPGCRTFLAEPDTNEADFFDRDAMFAVEIPNFTCASTGWSDPMDGSTTDAVTSFQWLNIPPGTQPSPLVGGFHWSEGATDYDLDLELTIRVAFGAPSCPAYTGSVDHSGPTPPYRGDWLNRCVAFPAVDVPEVDEFIIYSPSSFDPSDLNQCECNGITIPIGVPPVPADVPVACNADDMASVIRATIGGGTGTCGCVPGFVTFFFHWFEDDIFGHGVFVSNYMRLCGHAVHIRIACVDLGGGLSGWTLDFYVDGVSTGTIAWDLLPGNDAGNPNHFELHVDLFGDLCTGRLFIVAG